MQISAFYPGQEGFSRSIHRVPGNSGPPARPTAPPGVRQIGVAASLLMAAMGISVYALSGSEALLLDGLLSGVMAASSFIAARFGSNVVRPADRAYPYGYDGQEALYVLFRSLVLIGILSFAVITAGTTIVNHLAGQMVAAMQLRPVATYAGLMVVLCLALRQSAGAACDPGLIARTRDAVQELLSGMSTWLLDLTVMKVGRTTFVVAYLNPAMPVDGPWIDRLRERIDARCAELLGPVRTEVILTGQAPLTA